jgi:hypothetical protein
MFRAYDSESGECLGKAGTDLIVAASKSASGAVQAIYCDVDKCWHCGDIVDNPVSLAHWNKVVRVEAR